MILLKADVQHGKRFCSIEPMTMMMLGGGAANIGGSIFGGLFGSSAEKKRAAAIRAAGDQGAGEILQGLQNAKNKATEYNATARGDLAPFREMGVNAGTTLVDLLLGNKDMSALLKESELFKFQSEIGSRNINRELSARGLYGSGAGLETLARFTNQLSAEEGQRTVDRLMNLTTLGANSASNMASLTNQTGLSMADMMLRGRTAAAQMRFDGATGSAQANSNATRMLGDMGQNIFDTVGSGITNYGQYQLTKPIFDKFLSSGSGGGLSSPGKAVDASLGLNG